MAPPNSPAEQDSKLQPETRVVETVSVLTKIAEPYPFSETERKLLLRTVTQSSATTRVVRWKVIHDPKANAESTRQAIPNDGTRIIECLSLQ
jgi:hypothetical protein